MLRPSTSSQRRSSSSSNSNIRNNISSGMTGRQPRPVRSTPMLRSQYTPPPAPGRNPPRFETLGSQHTPPETGSSLPAPFDYSLAAGEGDVFVPPLPLSSNTDIDTAVSASFQGIHSDGDGCLPSSSQGTLHSSPCPAMGDNDLAFLNSMIDMDSNIFDMDNWSDPSAWLDLPQQYPASSNSPILPSSSPLPGPPPAIPQPRFLPVSAPCRMHLPQQPQCLQYSSRLLDRRTNDQHRHSAGASKQQQQDKFAAPQLTGVSWTFIVTTSAQMALLSREYDERSASSASSSASSTSSSSRSAGRSGLAASGGRKGRVGRGGNQGHGTASEGRAVNWLEAKLKVLAEERLRRLGVEGVKG
ncbi:hypothetical protein Slin15195_G130100 [Septoria linicola]|uniref:Uncharacterized protein n=1 Tax=Septoria linicola TaxID=215465 RepID=A0A9Q9B9U4_9PEZI|nr:hypothetical protein Slin15195_G130100 [Septoria linicola]